MSALIRSDGTYIAFAWVQGQGPTIVFLPGYMSDMEGAKARAIAAWAAHAERAVLRLDYSGCGASGGRFEDATLDRWRDDVLLAVGLLDGGPVVLVGSSLGGWLMLLVARALGDQVVGMIGIAAAPDFTDWGFTPTQKAVLERDGRLAVPSDTSGPAMVTTRAFWRSGAAHRELTGAIPIDCPVRLLHGQCDDAVPWEISVQLAAHLRSDDVQVTLIKDGDHRLSRPQDIALLLRILETL